MSPFILSIISVLIICLLSVVGVLGLLLKHEALNKVLIFLISFSAGSLIGSAFLHILPDVIADGRPALDSFVYLLVGFCFFFVLERFLRWRHCHEEECDTHEHLGWMNLAGGSIHNFIDGMVIASAFAVNPALGWPVAFSIIFHEIPHELGDFGVLIYSGFKKGTALLYNFISAAFAILGVFAVFFLFGASQSFQNFLLPAAAGGFIYIAASDLVPELHREKNNTKAVFSFLVFILALVFMYLAKIWFES